MVNNFYNLLKITFGIVGTLLFVTTFYLSGNLVPINVYAQNPQNSINDFVQQTDEDHETKIQLDDYGDVIQNSELIIAGKLIDLINDGKGIPTMKIVAVFEGKSKTTTTDIDGSFEFTFKVPKKDAVNLQMFSEEFYDSRTGINYKTSILQSQGISTVLPSTEPEFINISTEIQLDPIDEVQKNQQTLVKGTLFMIDEDGTKKELPNMNIHFETTNGGAIQPVKTDDDGIFRTSFTPNQEGDFVLTASFNGMQDNSNRILYEKAQGNIEYFPSPTVVDPPDWFKSNYFMIVVVGGILIAPSLYMWKKLKGNNKPISYSPNVAVSVASGLDNRYGTIDTFNFKFERPFNSADYEVLVISGVNK